MKPARSLILAAICMAAQIAPCVASSDSVASLIFPTPREITAAGKGFVLDSQATIAVPSEASPGDLLLARFLTDELGDRFAFHLKSERLPRLDSGRRVILMGSVANPLVAAYCAQNHIEVSTQSPGAEGYVLRVSANVVLIAGSDDRGAFYGLQSLRQLATKENGQLQFHGVDIRDWPDKSFRGIKLYLPGRNNIPFFKRFVRDFMALYKYNTLIMEMNANMRLESHPELNSGLLDFVRDTNYSRRNYPPGMPHDLTPNSSHQDTADGGFLEKDEVADLARWVRQNHIELIPELPSFTHSYYLLTMHKDLAEVPGEKWPDTYCPSNPKSYELLFEVYDEYIDLLRPRMIHAGHDELFAPMGLCPLCGNKDIGERYGEDVRKIHDHLAAKGIQLAIWGDMLLQGVRGVGLQENHTDDGWKYYAPGGMTREQVERLVPKDILIFNWFWDEKNALDDEIQLDQMGFKQIYGNFNPSIKNYETRSKRSTIIGGAPSAWFATNETGFGKELMADFIGSSSILWNGKVIDGKELSGLIQSMLPEIRIRFRGQPPPSQTEPSLAAVKIQASFNMETTEPKLGIDLSGMKTEAVSLGSVPFDLAESGPKKAILVVADGKESSGLPKEADIPVGEDATSLIFLHAAARPATNKESFRLIWDEEDTADMLGWYEVVYEDGFVTTIPIRYGVNITEWNWEKRDSSRDYAYGADAVAVGGAESNPITLFAFEWVNPRLGKVIKEVRLKGTTGFRGGDPGWVNDFGPVIPTNGVILKAISVVRKRQ
ncbi:MAG: glycoside hydrolase family 20 zincin-like fold domain-containing protein [Terriglobia bacterium]